MTREEQLELLKQIEKDIYVCSIESTFLDDAKSCAIHSAIEELEQEPCEDAISRQTVIDKMKERDEELSCLTVKDIRELPSVNPQLKTGHWISDLKSYGRGKDDYHCSICGRSIHLCRPLEQLTDYPYCHCGAKMTESEV